MNNSKNRTKTIACEQHNIDDLHRMYTGLFALEGMVKDNIPNASTTIDEVLYGNSETFIALTDELRQ
jgi:hypothetical protein